MALNLFAQALAAKDVCPGTEEEEYNLLVEEEEGELLEERHTRFGIEPVVIASELKPGTPAAYLVGETQKIVFCVDKNHILQDYSIKHDEDQYDPEPGPIGNASIRLNPSSKLTAAWTAKGAVVFFQDEQGYLRSAVASDAETWTVNSPLAEAVKPVIGTPLAARFTPLADGTSVQLYYSSEDEYVHVLTMVEGSANQDNQLNWAHLGDQKAKRFLIQQTEPENVLIYVLGADNSFRELSQHGTNLIGHVSSDGKLDLANKAESAMPEMRPDIWLWLSSFPNVEIKMRDGRLTRLSLSD
ncbi:hypothetical protein BDZ91DRAFT_785110 [Kalaharituber pfeilii]|nr:hypothetical protein BDZ91DRAFT_785110 [Kalaharituber pfeilii]